MLDLLRASDGLLKDAHFPLFFTHEGLNSASPAAAKTNDLRRKTLSWRRSD
jgi:hypothetical protein